VEPYFLTARERENEQNDTFALSDGEIFAHAKLTGFVRIDAAHHARAVLDGLLRVKRAVLA
jgi:bifunctional pyridoxal-dependent enzyme with beta-cystathionase and maltose regulon repressor activities